jgi:hypothetical protein
MNRDANYHAIMANFKKARDYLKEINKKAYAAVEIDNVSKMKKIFKPGEIEQDAIDLFIFWVKSLDMLKLFIKYGGDIHEPGPPLFPNPIPLLLHFTDNLENTVDSFEIRELVKQIKFLIEEGVELDIGNDEGSTPFIMCAQNDEMMLCELLVERGADPTLKKKDGGTALHSAAEKGCLKLIRYLVEDCGLEINAEYQDQFQPSSCLERTTLSLAAQFGNIEICIYLLAKGARVDVGYQALMVASKVY